MLYPVIFLVILAIMFLASAIRIVKEYELAVIFRLGKYIGKLKGPGLIILIPIIDKMVKINLRSETDLEEAERLLWEAKTQRGVDQMEIERHLSELTEIRSNLSSRSHMR